MTASSTNMSNPMLSVVIPNYNHARFLEQRIESVLNQTYTDMEVIILDDCSTDNSREVIERYRGRYNLQIHFNETNGGTPFKQWNKGVALARGTYVWIAESDDYADLRFLEHLVPVLEANQAIGLVKCQSCMIDENDQPLGLLEDSFQKGTGRDWSRDFTMDGRDECRFHLRYGFSINNASAVLFRRQLYVDVGGADESFRMAGDWMLWVKILLRSGFAYKAEPLNYFRCHPNSVRTRVRLTGIQELEDCRVLTYLFHQIHISDGQRLRTWDRMVQRWIDKVITLTGTIIPFSRSLEILQMVRQMDERYLWHIAKHALTRPLRAMAHWCFDKK